MTQPTSCLAALVLALCVLISACTSTITRPIVDDQGQAVPGAVAALEPVQLGGVRHWILIRGRARDLPLLLKIHGGPGQAEMATAPLNARLENDFIVVEWDQRGAGKSADASEPIADLTLARIVDDTIALSELLLRRFDRRSLVLVGHSWGSAVGLLAVQRRPELFRAFVSTGQMVDFGRAQRLGYTGLLDRANREGDATTARTLRELGPPPYEGPEAADRRDRYVAALERAGQLWHGPGGFDRVRWMLTAPEYGWVEKLRFSAAAQRSFERLLPDLLALDMARRVPSVEVPVYFATGRFDGMSPPPLARDYFDRLQAPRKHWAWFERSAHFPQWEEPEAFHTLLTQRVLPDTADR